MDKKKILKTILVGAAILLMVFPVFGTLIMYLLAM